MVARAFAVFAGGRPRPVHIELPLDIITAAADKLPPVRAVVPPSPPAASPAALQKAADWLNSAKAPVLLLGGGAQDAGPFVRALAEKLDAPTVMSVNGRGLLPPGHPLAVPCSPSMPPTMKLIESADVILAIGTEFGSTDYDWFEQGGAKFNGKMHPHRHRRAADRALAPARSADHRRCVGSGGGPGAAAERGASATARRAPARRAMPCSAI